MLIVMPFSVSDIFCKSMFFEIRITNQLLGLSCICPSGDMGSGENPFNRLPGLGMNFERRVIHAVNHLEYFTLFTIFSNDLIRVYRHNLSLSHCHFLEYVNARVCSYSAILSSWRSVNPI